ncbi:MAG: helix-turn-helix domain-containing protein [Candidatus Aphodocola sp.]
MAKFKIEKNSNYTVMSNYHLRDKKLSYKAKGLLSFMLSLPDNWDYSINGLVSISKEGVKAIRNILQELQQNGYLAIEKKQNELGQFEYEYLIYEIPDIQKGDMDLGDVEKDTQINTNIINTKKQIDKDDKAKISSFFVAEEHNILTLELIDRGYINENDTQIFYYDKLFEDLLTDGNSYKDLICIIHYIVPRVVKRNFEDEDGNIIKNKYGYFKSSIESNIHKLNNPIENLWDYDEDLFNDLYSDYSK